MQYQVLGLLKNILMYLNDPFVPNKKIYKIIAEKLNLKPDKVELTIKAFFKKTSHFVTSRSTISIRGFGTFLPTKRTTGKVDRFRYKVHLLRLKEKVKRLRLKKRVNSILSENKNINL